MAKINFSSSSIEDSKNKKGTISSSSTTSEYPTAKATYDYVNNLVDNAQTELLVQINERPIPGDYIVARYSNTNWHWAVYNSGWCECYGYLYINTTMNDPWGNIYEGDGYSLSYPVTFRSVPYEFAQANLSCGSFTEAYIKNTTTHSSTYYPLRPANGTTGDGYIYFRVAGYLAA